MLSIRKKVLSRIYGRGRGWAFSSKDFVEQFSRNDVDKALSLLNQQGAIRRVLRGIYDYPKYSKLLKQTLSPDIDQIAQAISRKLNWQILPSGETALNILGISKQIPAKYIYLTNGANNQYQIGNIRIEFKKTSLKDVGFKFRESGLIVQGLKALGKANVNKKIINTIQDKIDKKKHRHILTDTRWVTGWIYDYIKDICSESTQ